MTRKEIDAMISLIRFAEGGDVRLPRHHARWLMDLAEQIYIQREAREAHNRGEINDSTYWARNNQAQLAINQLFAKPRTTPRPVQQPLLEAE